MAPATETLASALGAPFFARSVHDVARDLIGCTIEHAGSAGMIVETESYHESEPACHAYVGPTERNRVLFDAPGSVYVYLSYGVHNLLNFVTNERGEGAAVLIRALQPTAGIVQMRARRGAERLEDLCSGPGKLAQALGIGLELNGSPVDRGPIRVAPPQAGQPHPEVVTSRRIGITKAADLPWRFSFAGSRFVSGPRSP